MIKASNRRKNMAPYSNTTEWKLATNMKSINLNMPYALFNELNAHTRVTASNRSEIIRNSIRLYLRTIRNELAEQERIEIQNYHTHQQNQRRQVNTGLLPDY